MNVITLGHPEAVNPQLTGGKASRLAQLRSQGHAVPDGVVVTTRAFASSLATLTEQQVPGSPVRIQMPPDVAAAICEHLRGGILRGARVAVRSSAVAEDLSDASFAGQYDTFLDLGDEHDVLDAVERCVASAFSIRAQRYRSLHGDLPAGVAVLIQRFVEADAAGVAFTAHPVTGERDVVVVSAVRGVGESLVSGLADAEEWEVRPAGAVRQRSPEPVLHETQAQAIAALASDVAAGANGVPQDVEWAIAGSEVFLLQARPMTALPEPVRWDPPAPGGWVRHFRLGEWIGAPVTPLFESWLITRVEARFNANVEDLFGVRNPDPAHVIVNGWYFYGLTPPRGRDVLRRLPVIAWRVARQFRQCAAMVPPLAPLGFSAAYERWRTVHLPAYQKAVAAAGQTVDTCSLRELTTLIDTLADAVGDQFTSIVGVSGYAAKAERPLARFWNEHLSAVDGSWLHLVRGDSEARTEAHHLEGLDWIFPTFGERFDTSMRPSADRLERLHAERAAVHARVRTALAAHPRRLSKFDALLSEARRGHAARQEQTGLFTLAWPVFRRALARIGEAMAARGVVAQADDVFYITRDELQAVVEGRTISPPITERRALWQRQRRLAPPLVIGELSPMFKSAFDAMRTLFHGESRPADGELHGMPGSAGRVTATARVLRTLDELPRLRDGEILVAPVTTPGWTPAFARAAAVVTDTGSMASHASIVAREYGIPAVVGVEGATVRIADGMLVTVDGTRGLVRLESAVSARG